MASIKDSYPCIVNVEEFLADKQEFDFIIVGGGTAGLVVATRLTEDPSVTVGVIEAGAAHIDDTFIDTPGLVLQLLQNPEYDWNYETVEQISGEKTYVNRGFGLGGSSMINWMFYNRGDSYEYDAWDELGNKGWSWKDLFPYFLKHEHAEPPTNIDAAASFDNSIHSTTGPIHTSAPSLMLSYAKDLYESSVNSGLALSEPLGDPAAGISMKHYLGRNSVNRSDGPGKRSHAVAGYLKPNAHRPNLKIIVNSLVHRVILADSDQGPRATAVEFEVKGHKHVVNSAREVIISTGPMETPKLLELSGIGNPEILTAAGIPVKVDNKAVGENYHDHVANVIVYELTPGETSMDVLRDPVFAAKAMQEYTEGKENLIAYTANYFAPISFAQNSTDEEIKSIINSATTGAQSPHHAEQMKILARRIASPESTDVALITIPAYSDVTKLWEFKAFMTGGGDLGGKIHTTICNNLRHPFSRGSIHIVSSDPHVRPRVDPRHLTHPADMMIMSKTLLLLSRVMKAQPMAAKVVRRVHPPEDVDLEDEKNCVEYLTKYHVNEFHSAGTAALGTVLDERCRVKGVQGLRVVDSSIFPIVPTANTQSVTYAVAEKASDMIKEDWNLKMEV